MEFIDLKAQYRYLKSSIDNRIAEVLENANFIDGNEVALFESELAKYVGRKHCISCGNGTDAIQLAFMALGIETNDYFICPNMTFFASAEAGAILGAKPILCDIDASTYNIDPKKVIEIIEKFKDDDNVKIKAIVSVDFLGNPADYDELIKICDKYNLYLIEDAAQSMSAEYKGKKCGSFGIISTTSFFPSKPLGCYGDGGAIFTDDDNLAKVLKSLKSHGKGKDKYDNIRIGMNSRLDTLQAVILQEKLIILEEELKKRQLIADKYINELSGYVQTPNVTSSSKSAFAQFVIMANDENEKKLIVNELSKSDIPTISYYPNVLSEQKALNYNIKHFDLSVSKRYSLLNVGLPFSPYLKFDDQVRIINLIRKVINGGKQ